MNRECRNCAECLTYGLGERTRCKRIYKAGGWRNGFAKTPKDGRPCLHWHPYTDREEGGEDWHARALSAESAWRSAGDTIRELEKALEKALSEKARPDTCAHYICPNMSDAVLRDGYWCPCCGDLLTWEQIEKARAHR